MLEEGPKNSQSSKMQTFYDQFKQLIFNKCKETVMNNNKVFNNQVTAAEQKSVNLNQIFGLRNLGNTCFFNSVMQCLNGAVKLTTIYTDLTRTNFAIPYDEEEEDGWNVVEKNNKQSLRIKSAKGQSINVIFQNFLLTGRRMKGNTLDPSDVFKQVSSVYGRFRAMAQQDAQELLRCLLDALSTGEDKTKAGRINTIKTVCKPKRTIVENIFGSYLLKCLDCQHTSRTFDFCLDYALQIARPKAQIQGSEDFVEIPEEELKNESIPYYGNNILLQKESHPLYKSDNLSLQNCIDSFTEYEELNLKKNFFKCTACQKNGKQSSRALRKFYFYDLPQIATFVLKRFQQKSANSFQKVADHVEFTEYIDLLNYAILKGDAKDTAQEVYEEQKNLYNYRLFGVVVHQGTMTGGHYISYVRHQEQWFYFSDSNYKEVGIKNVLCAQAYILFYERL